MHRWIKIRNFLARAVSYCIKNRKFLLIAGLFLALNVIAFIFIQLSSTQSLRNNLQSRIQALDTFRTQAQSISSPNKWEPGQPNTLLSYQIDQITNLKAPDSIAISTARQRAVGLTSAYEPNYKLNPTLEESLLLVEADTAEYRQSLESVNDFMGFNCFAYFNNQDISSEDLKSVYLDLVNQTEQQLSKVYVDQQAVQQELSKALESYRQSLQANSSGKQVVPVCEESQKQVQQAFITLWSAAYLNPLNTQLNTAISLLNAQLSQL